jgi:NAD(P)-dependent dehydrogenase (short-subunit alcohol dehydrogenase family)
MGRLDGKIAFVAGASSGIGRATAKRFAAEGAIVAFCARRAALLRSLEAEIAEAGGEGYGQVLDIGDLDAYAGALETTAARFGKLDIFVHNAMYGGFSPLIDTPIAEWRENFRINAESCFAATSAAIRIMTPLGRGAIVNIATISALRGVKGCLDPDVADLRHRNRRGEYPGQYRRAGRDRYGNHARFLRQ